MRKCTLTTLVFLLIIGTTLAQPARQKKERTFDRTGISQQADQEYLRSPVQITDVSKLNDLCTVLFSWEGVEGYTMSSTMTYDPSQADGGVISAEGAIYGNFNNGVIDLVISFFDPDGIHLGTIINVENGVVLYDWLEIYFDIDTEEFFSDFDVGQYRDSPDDGDDDLYLYGLIGDWYGLDVSDDGGEFTLDESEDDFVITTDNVSCSEPVPVPISNSAILLVILLMISFMVYRIRIARV